MFRSYRFQNPGPDTMKVRVEMWSDEFLVAPGSCLTLRCLTGDTPEMATVEWVPDGLTFWPECYSYTAAINGVPCAKSEFSALQSL